MFVIVTRWTTVEGPDNWRVHRREDKQPFTWNSQEKAEAVCKCTFYNKWKQTPPDVKVVSLEEFELNEKEVYF